MGNKVEKGVHHLTSQPSASKLFHDASVMATPTVCKDRNIKPKLRYRSPNMPPTLTRFTQVWRLYVPCKPHWSLTSPEKRLFAREINTKKTPFFLLVSMWVKRNVLQQLKACWEFKCNLIQPYSHPKQTIATAPPAQSPKLRTVWSENKWINYQKMEKRNLVWAPLHPNLWCYWWNA